MKSSMAMLSGFITFITGFSVGAIILTLTNYNILFAIGGDNQIILEWYNENEVDDLNIYRKKENSTSYYLIANVSSLPNGEYIDEGLPADTKYNYKVTEVYNGEETLFDEVSARTNKPNPTDLSITYSINNVEDDVVSMFLNVIDQNGNPIKGLGVDNFEILQDNRNKKIYRLTSIRTDKTSISGVLTMDYSDSMSDFNVQQMELLIENFINQKSYNDDFEIIKFSNYINRANHFKTNKNHIKSIIKADYHYRDSTSFYDSIYEAVLDVSLRPIHNNKRFIIAFTDGIDNNSAHSINDVINLAKDTDVPIYIVAYRDDQSINSSGYYGYTNDDFEIATQQMKKIAEESGGYFFSANTQSTGIYEMVYDQIENSYIMEINTQNPNNIKISVNYEDLSTSVTTKGISSKNPVNAYYQPIFYYLNKKNNIDNSKIFRFYTSEKGGFIPITKDISSSLDTEIDPSAYLILKFRKSIDTQSLMNSLKIKNLIKLTRKNNITKNDIIPFDVEKLNSSSTLYAIKPITKFKHYKEHITKYIGIKPNYLYEVTIKGGSGGLKTTSGDNYLNDDYSWKYLTKDLDYGLYWFGDNNKCEKFVPGRPNPYYNPNNKTFIYVHGWKNDSVGEELAENYYQDTNADYLRESFMWAYEHRGIVVNDTSKVWRDDNWNTGIFQWNQFADEDGDLIERQPEKAEAKIWRGENEHGAFTDVNMRYRTINPLKISNDPSINKSIAYYINTSTDITTFVKDFPIDKSIGELFRDIYREALKSQRNDNIRLAGHSLGGQIVTYTSWLLKEDHIKNPLSTERILPSRIALLDPYWSDGEKSYIQNMASDWSSDVEIKKHLIKDDNTSTHRATYFMIKDLLEYYKQKNGKDLAIEQYRTSDLSGDVLGFMGGDRNEPLKALTCYTEVEPSYIDEDYGFFTTENLTQVGEEGHKHNIAPRYYMHSYNYIFGKGANHTYSPSAKIEDKYIIGMMNDNDKYDKYIQIEGMETIDLDDDVFGLLTLQDVELDMIKIEGDDRTYKLKYFNYMVGGAYDMLYNNKDEGTMMVWKTGTSYITLILQMEGLKDTNAHILVGSPSGNKINLYGYKVTVEDIIDEIMSKFIVKYLRIKSLKGLEKPRELLAKTIEYINKAETVIDLLDIVEAEISLKDTDIPDEKGERLRELISHYSWIDYLPEYSKLHYRRNQYNECSNDISFITNEKIGKDYLGTELMGGNYKYSYTIWKDKDGGIWYEFDSDNKVGGYHNPSPNDSKPAPFYYVNGKNRTFRGASDGLYGCQCTFAPISENSDGNYEYILDDETEFMGTFDYAYWYNQSLDSDDFPFHRAVDIIPHERNVELNRTNYEKNLTKPLINK